MRSTNSFEIPADLADKAAEYRERMIETAVEQDDEVMEAYLEGNIPDAATLKALIRKGTMARAFRAGAVRFGVQEQGRAAVARCGGRLHAVAARRAGDQGRAARQRRGGRAPLER